MLGSITGNENVSAPVPAGRGKTGGFGLVTVLHASLLNGLG